MPETGPAYTPENPTQGYPQEQQSLEQPASVEALPPQDYVDTSSEDDPEGNLNFSIRGADHPSNMLNPTRMATENSLTESLNGFNSQQTTPEAQPSDLTSDIPASNLPEMTSEERAAKAEYIDALSHDILYPNDPEYNQEQLENITIMNGLLKKYPHAFTKYSTNDGRDYSVLKPSEKWGYIQDIDSRKHGGDQYIDGGIILSYKGVEVINKDSRSVLNSGEYDLSPVLDAEDIGNINDQFDKELGHFKESAYFYLYTDGPKLMKPTFLDYATVRAETLKQILEDSEYKHRDDAVSKPTAKDILALL